MSWRSIDESGPLQAGQAEEVVVLRGIPATVPQSYERFYRSRRALGLGTIALLLQRLIAVCIAAVAHVLVAALLLSVYLDMKGEDQSELWASLYRQKAEEVKVPEPAKPEPPKEEPKPPPVEPTPPEPPKPEPPKPEPVKPVAKAPEPEPPTPVTTPVPVPVESPRPPPVGAGATAAGRPSVTDKEVEKDPTAAIRRRRAEDVERLRGGTAAEIVVVAGCYDHVEEVLGRLEIPHRLIDAERLPRADLSKCRALLINCDNRWAAYLFKGGDARALEKQIASLAEQEADLRKRIDRTRDKQTLYKLDLLLLSVTSQLEEYRRQVSNLAGSARTVEVLQDFVKDGGYVFTSDWGLSVLERVWPGFVKYGGTAGPRTVSIRPKAGKEKHALLEEVFYAPARGTTTERRFLWEVDPSSYLVRIEKPAAVETLVESPELGRYNSVAVAFAPEGTGKVLHVLSHFRKQSTKQGDFALQNMLLNFLLERARK